MTQLKKQTEVELNESEQTLICSKGNLKMQLNQNESE